MTTFSLSEVLQRKRERLGYTLEDIAKVTNIHARYFEAWEQKKRELLIDQVFALHVLKAYTQALQLSWNEIMVLYTKEEGFWKGIGLKKKGSHPRFHFVFPYELVWKLGFLIVVICVFGYLSFQVYRIVSIPFLEVTQPLDQIIIHQRHVEVLGKTNKEASVAINGKSVFVESDGSFLLPMDLREGLNRLEIKAQKKYSKPTLVYRHIVVQSTDQP